MSEINIYKNIAFVTVFIGLLLFFFKFSNSTILELNKNVEKSKTFKNYRIITNSKDTIQGNFYMNEEGGSLFSSGDHYYLDLKDSTKYYTKNIISITPIKK